MLRNYFLILSILILAACGSGSSGSPPPPAEEGPIKIQASLKIQPFPAGAVKFIIYLNVTPEGTPLEAELNFWFQGKAKDGEKPFLPVYRVVFSAPGSYDLFFESGMNYTECHAILRAWAGEEEMMVKANWPKT